MTSNHESRTTTRTVLPVGLAAIAFAAVLAVGCGTDTATTEPSPPSSTVTTVPPAISTTLVASTTPVTSTTSAAPTTIAVPDDRVQGLLDRWASEGRGGVAVALAGHDEELTVAAAGSAGPGGGLVEPGSAFRVGSLSKTFVAVMLLQLVDDGTIGLDDLVVDRAPELTIADGVTIRQLLAHRSGLAEYADGELAPAVLADPARTWTPADVLELVADQPRDFAPGTQFAYSNTNYIVAGLLLEGVTGMTLAENLQSRIVEPLGLKSTYFAPDDTRSPIGGFSNSLPGGDTNGASYRALETSAGAAGAVVSTASDLAIFIRALAHGELLDEPTYAEMTKGLPADGQTLGVFPADPPSTTGISNSGNVPGFTAYMQYDPVTEDLFVLLLNDDTRSPEQLGTDLSEIIRNI
ncbi:MAG: serine hydrolase domain-containing protein [Acidimicrobiales bacterium]